MYFESGKITNSWVCTKTQILFFLLLWILIFLIFLLNPNRGYFLIYIEVRHAAWTRGASSSTGARHELAEWAWAQVRGNSSRPELEESTREKEFAIKLMVRRRRHEIATSSLRLSLRSDGIDTSSRQKARNELVDKDWGKSSLEHKCNCTSVYINKWVSYMGE